MPRRRTAISNSTYRLTAQDRQILGIMSALELWTKTSLADLFGVTRKTVAVCEQRWFEQPTTQGEQ